MEDVEVQIKWVRRRDPALPMPRYMTDGAVGMDLCSDLEHEVVLGTLERALIPTGIAVALPHGVEAQIRPRSGLALEQGLTLVNSPGTIDSDYRGEIQLIVINLGKDPAVLKRGQRVAQMVIQKVCRARWKEVKELPLSERDDGGFGHTDKE